MRHLTKVAALAAMTVLSACSQGPFAPATPPMFGDTVADHPIGAWKDTRSLRLAGNGQGEVSADTEAVRAFVVDHARSGDGPITVRGRKSEIRTAFRDLMGAGALESDLRAVVVTNEYDVILEFPAWHAEAPRCGAMLSDARTVGLWNTRNDPASDWGCASQRNLAQMLVNPRDAITRRGDLPSGDAEAPSARVQDTRNYVRPDRPATTTTN